MIVTSQRRHRHRTIALAIGCVLALLGLSACSISTEERPRPITRETTVATPSADAP